MSDHLPLEGPTLLPLDGNTVESAVIFLHGLGADGNDLISLGSALQPHMPNTIFYSPDAPQACDMAPIGRQWFSLQTREPAVVEAGVKETAPILQAFIDQVLADHSLTPDKLCLVGFSQGTMMSLYVAPRREHAIGGVVGFSGALIAAETLSEEATAKPPVLLIHGDADEVVPFDQMTRAFVALQAAGFAVDQLARPGLGHGIDPEGLTRAAQFLVGQLVPASDS